MNQPPPLVAIATTEAITVITLPLIRQVDDFAEGHALTVRQGVEVIAEAILLTWRKVRPIATARIIKAGFLGLIRFVWVWHYSLLLYP
ncbi:MAG: hypothetical protein A2182_01460 [Candidatus Pacebacteria bacterium RIFOXYA1_FULL_38_18]|nr:MAG: hypothetical protein A2182_01460 [Candidatus Pacebacteria bacterium RIFOXYA1_FULL_38_18]